MSTSHSDPTPEGSLSLEEAYQQYAARMPGAYGAALHGAMVAAFSERELEAFVRFPGSAENMRVPYASWGEHPFPERVFMSPDIPDHFASTSWGAFVGRTLFTDEGAFKTWLDKQVSTRSEALARQFDPAAEAHWNLAMAIAWIGEQTFDAVREQWPRFRAVKYGARERDLLWSLDGSLSLTDDLLAQAAAGAIKLVGVDQETNKPTEVPAEELPYLQLAFDANLNPRLDRQGSWGTRYRDLRVGSAGVITAWPASKASARSWSTSDGRAQEQDRVRAALRVCFPEGVPSKEQMTSGQLYKRVAEHMDDIAKSDRSYAKAPSRDTILRAANRRN